MTHTFFFLSEGSISVFSSQQKPIGILALLDEESRFPKATDSTLVGEYDTGQKTNPPYKSPYSSYYRGWETLVKYVWKCSLVYFPKFCNWEIKVRTTLFL